MDHVVREITHIKSPLRLENLPLLIQIFIQIRAVGDTSYTALLLHRQKKNFQICKTTTHYSLNIW